MLRNSIYLYLIFWLATESLFEKHKENRTFTFENDTICQKLRIEYVSKNKILFNFVVHNKLRNLTISLSDSAELRYNKSDYPNQSLNYDMVLDEKSQEPFTVIRYFDLYKCDYLLIEIEEEVEVNQRAYVGGTGVCDNLPNGYCPLRSIGVMREDNSDTRKGLSLRLTTCMEAERRSLKKSSVPGH